MSNITKNSEINSSNQFNGLSSKRRPHNNEKNDKYVYSNSKISCDKNLFESQVNLNSNQNSYILAPLNNTAKRNIDFNNRLILGKSIRKKSQEIIEKGVPEYNSSVQNAFREKDTNYRSKNNYIYNTTQKLNNNQPLRKLGQS